MISYEKAQEIILAVARRSTVLGVPIVNALGKIAAHDIIAPINVPSFDNSAMDGFAVKSKDLSGASAENPISLPIIETIGAGDEGQEINANGAVHIMTGAKIPFGFDAVVPIENVAIEAKTAVFSSPVSKGNNIRGIGQDVNIGQEILGAQTRISAELIMLLASIGIKELKIFETPILSIFSTGNEIIDYNEPVLPNGKIYNSTAPYLLARAKEIGIDAQYHGIIKDDASMFAAQIGKIASGNIIITTGAVSMGKWDFIPQALKSLGANIHFHKVNIRPGKPIIFASLPNGNLFFGLPGNPISSAIGFKFFVETAISAMTNSKPSKKVTAILENDFENKGDFRQFVKAVTRPENGKILTRITHGQESFKISPMAAANSWAILPEAVVNYKKGDVIEIILFGTSDFEGVLS